VNKYTSLRGRVTYSDGDLREDGLRGCPPLRPSLRLPRHELHSLHPCGRTMRCPLELCLMPRRASRGGLQVWQVHSTSHALAIFRASTRAPSAACNLPSRTRLSCQGTRRAMHCNDRGYAQELRKDISMHSLEGCAGAGDGTFTF
jgi:hypothetical protein